MNDDPTQWFLPPVPEDIRAFNRRMDELRERSEKWFRKEIEEIRRREDELLG